MELLGATKLTHNGKITLISDVRKKLKAKSGDVIGFYLDDKGNIVITKG